MILLSYYPSAAERTADKLLPYPERARLAVLREGIAYELPGAAEVALTPRGDWREGAFSLLATLPTGEPLGPVESLTLGTPVLRPRQFLDFYAFEQHVRTARGKRGLGVVPEWYEVPAYYNSNPLSLYAHGERVLYPAGEDRLDFELELACVLGHTLRNATLEQAQAAIAGYTILNDLSARSRQRQAMAIGLGPSPGKDFGSVLGPYLVTSDELPDPTPLTMRAFVNGELWTEGVFGSIHYSFAEMIVYASRSRTLFPGDVIGSGTVGGGCGLELDRFLQPGDVIRLEIDRLGVLENVVAVEG